jgi:hypothetical protein
MSSERRRYFRIEDIVCLNMDIVPDSDLEFRLQDFWHNLNHNNLQNQYNQRLNDHRSDLLAIQTKMPELGRYLAVLQDQIDVLNNKILHVDDEGPTIEKTVSLSAQGVAFYVDGKVNEGDVVEINLILQPSRQKIAIFARVVKVSIESTSKQGQYYISLEFEHIHEADREILIKHIHGKQLQTLSANRFEPV